MQIIPFSQARAHLADTLNLVENAGEPALISRRGQSAAVLMSVAQFERLSGRDQGFAERLQAWRSETFGAGKQKRPVEDASAADPWDGLRDRSEGRKPAW